MEITSYYHLVSSEKRARRYLAKKCLNIRRRICPRCNGKKIYRLANDRCRCARCKYTFHDFSGRWINRSNLSCVQWLSIIKLFELEVSPQSISNQLNISYKTVVRAIAIIRRAIVDYGRSSLESFQNGSFAYGVREDGGRAQIKMVPNLTITKLSSLPIRKFRKGSIVYTTQYNGYDGLIAHGARYETGYNGKRLFGDQSNFSELQGFMNWATDRFQKYRMVSKKQFPLLLKELEFRYNHLEADFFDLIANAICSPIVKATDLVPNFT